ncbi:hypothetical protein VTK73DRAFT_2218 [Phialemonium thermophilum]|uniref:Transcription initiation factor TFIID subunit 9 n=1 Tax=Phialemonium thermophilum TaxID=223376 RepID=A0ABR3Y2K1_9PEZI
MATTSSVPQTNGVTAPSPTGSTSQTFTGPQSQVADSQSSQPAAAQSQQPQQQQPSQSMQSQSRTQTSSQSQLQSLPSGQTTSPAALDTTAPRPRDARTIELLLTAQGVTAFEARVPLLLLDFAYRHTSSVLSDALHLSADPYTSQAGARPSATSGAAPVNVGDATVSANAVQLAIASRLGYQFRGGGAATAGGVSKDWMLELARERNKVALPRVAPSEWGVRLPSERFVLSGLSWGLTEGWAELGERDDSDEEEQDDDNGNAMEGVETTEQADDDVGGDGVEGGTIADVFGGEMEDEIMGEE